MTPRVGEEFVARKPSITGDDQTAIQVVDGEVQVISEGQWRHFAADPSPAARPSSGSGEGPAPA